MPNYYIYFSDLPQGISSWFLSHLLVFEMTPKIRADLQSLPTQQHAVQTQVYFQSNYTLWTRQCLPGCTTGKDVSIRNKVYRGKQTFLLILGIINRWQNLFTKRTPPNKNQNNKMWTAQHHAFASLDIEKPGCWKKGLG